MKRYMVLTIKLARQDNEIYFYDKTESEIVNIIDSYNDVEYFTVK